LYYIQWISDCFPLDFYFIFAVQRLELNFMKEIAYGDEGQVIREQNAPNDYSLQIVTRDNGVSCKARIVFKETTEFFVC
jgi:acyl-ACP thioesterase